MYSTSRERSWLAFNRRVLLQATRPDVPLLERVRFLAIFQNNLDEFFTARAQVSQQAAKQRRATAVNQKIYLEYLAAATEQQALALEIYVSILQELRQAGIEILEPFDLSSDEQHYLGAYLAEVIAPATDVLPAESLAALDSRALYLAAGTTQFEALIRVPDRLARFVAVPGRAAAFVRLESLMQWRSDLFLPQASPMYALRLTRRANIELKGQIDWEDVAHALESRLDGGVSRLEVQTGFPWLEHAQHVLGLWTEETTQSQILDLRCFESIANLPRQDLKFEPFVQRKRSKFYTDPFSAIERKDLALYHPSDDYNTVVHFVLAAAQDPEVEVLRATLYRLGRENPIAEALLLAAKNGKDVAVFLEGRARFDELANLYWSLRFRAGGVRVLPYPQDLKVHAKALYVRRKGKGFVHLGTGNYNPATGRLYTDLSLLSASKRLTKDALEFFSALEQNRPPKLEWMKVGLQARETLIQRILEEAHPSGHIILKLNHLTDPSVLSALEQAALEGAKVQLIIRSTLTRIHPKFHARSLVGRFLEHSRIAAFKRYGDWELWAGSADWMPRNFEKRLELVFPILEKTVRTRVLKLLQAQLEDDVNAFVLESNGAETALWGGSKDSQKLRL
ncbi:MAG: polyphosphate kinase [Deinococcales bacterium]